MFLCALLLERPSARSRRERRGVNETDMRSFVIKLKRQQDAEVKALRNSIKDTKSPLSLNIWDATTPDTFARDLNRLKNMDPRDWKWTWPVKQSQDGLDLKTGVYKFMYQAANQEKKIATSLSHVSLWDVCVQLDEPIVIFEADALLTRTFEPEAMGDHDVVGLNDPRGATRRAQLFHDKVSAKNGIQPVPSVNHAGERPVPQGLAGHSAYYITPAGAKKLLDKVKEYGMWPNDAYMCKELFPWIRVTYPYYTRVQGTVSTTTR